MSINLSDYLWENRVILVKSSPQVFADFMSASQEWTQELEQRKLVVKNEPDEGENNIVIQLYGLDGEMKHEMKMDPEEVDEEKHWEEELTAIFRKIDTMPEEKKVPMEEANPPIPIKSIPTGPIDPEDVTEELSPDPSEDLSLGEKRQPDFVEDFVPEILEEAKSEQGDEMIKNVETMEANWTEADDVFEGLERVMTDRGGYENSKYYKKFLKYQKKYERLLQKVGMNY